MLPPWPLCPGRSCFHASSPTPAPLQELRGERTIVFTSSVEATHRLHLLLAALTCLPDGVVEFSSLVPPAERAAHLEAFRSGQAKVGVGWGVGWVGGVWGVFRGWGGG